MTPIERDHPLVAEITTIMQKRVGLEWPVVVSESEMYKGSTSVEIAGMKAFIKPSSVAMSFTNAFPGQLSRGNNYWTLEVSHKGRMTWGLRRKLVNFTFTVPDGAIPTYDPTDYIPEDEKFNFVNNVVDYVRELAEWRLQTEATVNFVESGGELSGGMNYLIEFENDACIEVSVDRDRVRIANVGSWGINYTPTFQRHNYTFSYKLDQYLRNFIVCVLPQFPAAVAA